MQDCPYNCNCYASEERDDWDTVKTNMEGQRIHHRNFPLVRHGRGEGVTRLHDFVTRELRFVCQKRSFMHEIRGTTYLKPWSRGPNLSNCWRQTASRLTVLLPLCVQMMNRLLERRVLLFSHWTAQIHSCYLFPKSGPTTFALQLIIKRN